MIKLTVTANDHSVTLQDPRPITQNNEEQAVISVTAGTSKSIDMQWGQLERLSKQLTDLAALGMCTFVIESSSSPYFVSQADAPSNPMIDLVTGTFTAAAGVTDGVLTGVNFLSGQARAGFSIDGSGGTGKIMLIALTPGFPGLDLQVEIIDSGGGGGLNVSHSGSLMTIDLGGTTPTITATVSAINTEMAGILVAAAYDSGTDTLTSTMSATNFVPFSQIKVSGHVPTGTLVLTSFSSIFPAPSDIDVTIIDSGGTGGLSVTYSNKSLLIDIDGTSPTIAAVVTAVNAAVTNGDISASYVGTSTDTITSAEELAETYFPGGDGGTGWTLTIGGVAATITAVDIDTPTAETITFDVGAVGTAADRATVLLRSNEKITVSNTILG